MWYAKYSSFEVDNEATGYELHVSGYSGDVGDYFGHNNGMKFTTYDRDNDVFKTNCAKNSYGAWWYKSCTYVNPNGQYDRFEQQSSYDKRLGWYTNRLIFSEMKIRRK